MAGLAIFVLFDRMDTLQSKVFIMATSMNISLSMGLREFVKKRVSKDDYSNASSYIRDLIMQDKKRYAQERLGNLILEGIQSGPATPMTDDDWDEMRASVRARIEANNFVTG
jgi:antitoxin ParD1/3/4